jgi:putative ABC transport system permease protein
VAQELGGRDPLGQTLRNVDGDTETQWRIVGVVDNAVQTRTEDGMRPAVYIPYTQADWPIVEVVVRSDLPAEVLIPELRKAVARFSPYVPALDVRTMQARMAATRATPRFQTLLLTAFALLALLLAAAGLYGSMAHAVARRKRELGIRTALGAEPAGLLALVLGRGMRLTAAGMTMGLLGALALTRLLRGFLFGVEPGDPATLGLAAAVLALTALAASVLPALRAARVDPIEVLRAE